MKAIRIFPSKRNWLGCLLALAGLLLASQPAHATLLLQYTFDDSTNAAFALDSSANPTNGFFTGAATRTASGQTPTGTGYALNLVGSNNWLTVSNAAKLNPTGGLTNFTLVTWLNLQGDPALSDRLFGKETTTNGFGLELYTPTSGTISSTNFRLALYVNNLSSLAATTANLNATNRWLFVAVTYDGTGTVGDPNYKNVTYYTGTPVASVAQFGAGIVANRGYALTNTSPLRIGSTPASGSDRTPPAWLDDVRIYDTILTASDLEAIRQQDVPPMLVGNVLANPSFESDPFGETTNLLGWIAYGGNAYSETSQALALSGTNYFKVHQAFNGQVNNTGIYQDYISGPGAVYSADGWACNLSSDKLAGQNLAWIEVTFRDANANVLALYRSALITTNSIATGAFPMNIWTDLPVTNQYNPNTGNITNTVAQLVAPTGTYFIRYQVNLQGDTNAAAKGSVYFDDLNLAPADGASYGSWNIVWSDEFNGTNLNPTVWTYDTGTGCPNCGWGNSELEYYTSRTNNAFVSGGLLHIVAQEESYGGQSYTSARMKSQGRFSCQYGRLEWRAKLPSGVGCWPALWLLGTNFTTIGWPGCGEIDVMENNGSTPGTVQSALHSGSDETGYYNFLNGDSVTNFHTYTLDWSPTAILYYVDGHLYQSQSNWDSSVGGAYPFPFNQPFFFIMNLAIGGDFLSNPSQSAINAGTAFPAEMQVDYVRIYNLTAPLMLSFTRTNSNLILAWPSSIVCHLQTQTNLLGTSWSDIVTTSNSIQINPSGRGAFYRLKSP